MKIKFTVFCLTNFLLIFFALLNFDFAFSAAQNINLNKSCPYTFTRNLQAGFSGEDVVVLQKILNTYESMNGKIVVDGIFGQNTAQALVNFQNTHLEYVGIANGIFGSRTRTVMNSICAGGVVQNVQADNPSTNTQNLPQVTLLTNSKTLKDVDSFRVTLNASKEIKPITPETISITGGIVKDIRKKSKVTYDFAVLVDDSAKEVELIVEADKIEDMSGNLNSDASDVLIVKINRSITQIITPKKTISETEIKNTIEQIVKTAPITQPTQNIQYYNCNGRAIPTSQPCQIDPYTQAQQQYAQQQAYQQARGGFGGGSFGGRSFGGGGYGSGGISGILDSITGKGGLGGGLNGIDGGGGILGGLGGLGGGLNIFGGKNGGDAQALIDKLQKELQGGLNQLPKLAEQFSKNVEKIQGELDKCLKDTNSQCNQGLNQIQDVMKKAEAEIKRLQACVDDKSKDEACKNAKELLKQVEKTKDSAEKLSKSIKENLEQFDGAEGKVASTSRELISLPKVNGKEISCPYLSDKVTKDVIYSTTKETGPIRVTRVAEPILVKSILTKKSFFFYSQDITLNNKIVKAEKDQCYLVSKSSVTKKQLDCCNKIDINTKKCAETVGMYKNYNFYEYTGKADELIFSTAKCAEIKK